MQSIELERDTCPDIDDGIPLCTEDCPSYDGKRCRQTGFRPDRICEPVIKMMAELITIKKR